MNNFAQKLIEESMFIAALRSNINETIDIVIENNKLNLSERKEIKNDFPQK